MDYGGFNFIGFEKQKKNMTNCFEHVSFCWPHVEMGSIVIRINSFCLRFSFTWAQTYENIFT